MISILHAVVLGLVQGISELFPISSLGHSVIIPKLFGWKMKVDGDQFLTFLVATHLATALVLLGFFWQDWVRIVKGFVRSVGRRSIGNDGDARLAWLLIFGTIPAGVIGLGLQKPLQNLFTSPVAAAIFLIANGALLYVAERLRRRAPVAEPSDDPRGSDRRLASLSFRQATAVGLAQCLALIPGFSRAGATMAGGLRVGLSNEDAARFAFLLATPIIGAAALLKLPHVFGAQGDGIRGACLTGAICAAVAAWLSVRFLVRYFETNRLTPFAVYCVVAGVVVLPFVAR